jgi:sortase A
MTGHTASRPVAAWLRVVEGGLLVVAVVALGWYGIARVEAIRDQAAWTRVLEQQAAAFERRRAAEDVSRAATLEKGALIGRLEVPRLGLSVITREGADAGTLRTAVGHVPRTALPGEAGNAAFAGHRDTFFRGLQDVRPGDRVVITMPAGRYQYVVRDTRVVIPSDTSVLEPTAESTLTLVTCYPFNAIGPAPKRFIVRAARFVQ